MKDEAGRYVVIEIEPTAKQNDDAVFRHAARYAALVADAKRLPHDSVRQMVVSESIDPELRRRYRGRDGVESFVLTTDQGS